jgi:hypothetical protein
MSDFFDFFFVLVAIFVASLTVLDWFLGPGRREQLKQRVGDFWTTLQYQSIDQIYLSWLISFRSILRRLYGSTLIPVRLIIISFATNILLAFALLSGKHPLAVRYLIMEPFSGNWPTAIVVSAVVYAFAIGWVPLWITLKTLDLVSKNGIELERKSLLSRIWYSPYIDPERTTLFHLLIFGFLAFELLLIFNESDPIHTPFIDWVMRLLHVKSSWRDDIDHPDAALVIRLSALLTATRIRDSVILSSLFIPIAVLLFAGISILKSARPLIQPAVDVTLQRLYESKQGILMQLAAGAGLLAKLVQEIVKHS